MTADTVTRLGNLPAEPNSFVGRERDLGDLELLLSTVRALTLCGPGGIGKTRLAVRLGWQLAGDFPDGVWLVELADSADPSLAARRVATILRVGEEPDRPASATLVDALRGRKLLLILDTCEHIIDAVADLVHDLIAGCPLIRVVATSREPLRVRGETVWRVPPLTLPATAADATMASSAQHEALRLFLDRAAAVRPGFALTTDNWAPIVQLCRTLDGVPLAIELAAARIRALSTEQIAARIGNRFRLLASGDRTAPLRQQTLLATVDWSFDLLTPDEQILLRRLSVFSGWNLEMAEEVCADEQIPAHRVLDLLAALIDKSLVALEDEIAGDARYRLLDTIKAYAAEQLATAGEHEQFRSHHARYMLALAEDVVSKGFVRGPPSWPERVMLYRKIDTEQSNFRAALAFCLAAGDAERGLRLCSALRSPWVVHGDVTEGVGWFERFLALNADAPADVRIRALMLGAELAFEHQDYLGAARRAQAAVNASTACQAACPAGALRILALISLRAGLPEAALERADEAVAAARLHGDDWEEGLALVTRAVILARSGDLGGAQACYERALDVLADNNGWGVAHALYGFGNLARSRHDNAAALRHFRSALDLFRELDARTEIARCQAGIGWIALAENDLAAAAASFGESLELSMATGQRLGIARGLEAMAALAAARGDAVTAIRLEGAAAATREVLGPHRPTTAQARLDNALTTAHLRVGEELVASLAAEGGHLRMDEAVLFALASVSANGAEGEPHRDARADHAPSEPNPAGADADPTGGPPQPALPQSTLPKPALPAPALTAREQEIALLIARGLSNRGIADELVISPATAARHVANILGKLGLNSRAQVAAWTVGQGPEFGRKN